MANIQTVPVNLVMSILESKCESFTLTPYAMNSTIHLSIDQYEFHFEVIFNYSRQLGQVKVLSVVKLFEKSSDNRIELAELRSNHLFSVLNHEEIIQINPSGQFVIPNMLIEICNGISISSIRGMYSVKSENTSISNAVVPLIDPRALIPEQPFVARMA